MADEVIVVTDPHLQTATATLSSELTGSEQLAEFGLLLVHRPIPGFICDGAAVLCLDIIRVGPLAVSGGEAGQLLDFHVFIARRLHTGLVGALRDRLPDG